MDAVLQIEGVTKRFLGHTAVDNVTLRVERGSFTCLVGPSGCGKTTLLRLVAGLETPDAGGIQLGGRNITALKPHQRNVSTVFQSYALFPHLTASENVAFGLRRRRDPDIASKVREAFQLVQLEGKESRMPAQLSGGEKQRVALARSLVLRPEVLLLDEPLAALDPNLRKQVRGELKALQARTGITFLMVTHDEEEALGVASRIAILYRGRLEQVGDPRDVYLNPASRFVATFLGPVNWIDGIGVRPEALRISPTPPIEDGAARSLAATVESSLFLGDSIHVETVLASGSRAVAQISRLNGTYRPGDAVHVWWHPSDELKFAQNSESAR